MIVYRLGCSAGHEFEGWFKSSAAYEAQAEGRKIACPDCGSSEVSNALMAPAVQKPRMSTPNAVATSANQAVPPMAAEMAAALAAVRAHVEKNFDYVGDSFAEEARRIHYGETGHRPIYGETTLREAKELADEGVPVHPLPGPAPRPARKIN